MNSLDGIIEMTGIDRFMALELAAGTLQAEAGVTLSTRFIITRQCNRGVTGPCSCYRD
jgi:hypothetical protein